MPNLRKVKFDINFNGSLVNLSGKITNWLVNVVQNS